LRINPKREQARELDVQAEEEEVEKEKVSLNNLKK
jgi:hypothetical protein